jgi:predicted ATP-grasp superfamily ATP-dependent carboligase
MTVNMVNIGSLKSLKSMCLDSIVIDYNKEGKSAEKIRKQIRELPEILFAQFSQLKHLQEQTVNLTIANWRAHSFCLGTIENFSIHQPLNKIFEFISNKKYETVYIEDLKWNKNDPDDPMWERASKEKTLFEYGFKPAENVTVLLDKI